MKQRWHLVTNQRAAGAGVALALFALLLVPQARASSVPLMQNITGTANVFTTPLDHVAATDSKALTAPDSGVLEVTDMESNHAKLSWMFENNLSAASLLAQLNAECGVSTAGGDLALNFTTDVASSYHLRVHLDNLFLQGDGLSGAIDDKKLLVKYNIDLDQPFDTLEADGILQPGAHTFTVHGESTLFKIGAHLDLAGQVKLDLRSQPAAIPLPAGVWAGFALLTLCGILIGRRKLAVR